MTITADQTLLSLPITELIQKANQIRIKYNLDSIETCNILNAKSGQCAEDCKFCAQSAHYQTNSNVYPLKTKTEMIEAAKKAKQIGAKRFDIVTSGPSPSAQDLTIIKETIHEIVTTINIPMCASLGALNRQDLTDLKKAGLTRYHHNIETSQRFYPNIVSTHGYEERIATIKAAKDVGLQVCSGGIIGLGETLQDRLDMALTLKSLNVDSIPINILMPIPGTPLENQKPLSVEEIIRTIAIFRITLEDKIIKIAAGRETQLKDAQALAFMAGANGMLIGGYLTIKGRSVEEDHKLINEIETIWQA